MMAAFTAQAVLQRLPLETVTAAAILIIWQTTVFR